MNHPRVLVTGVNGFVGRHVAEALHAREAVVIGVTLKDELPAELEPFVAEHLVCDLSDAAAVAKLNLTDIQAVINLAGIAVNDPNESAAEKLININTGVHTNLYQRFRTIGSNPRIIAVSTGALYNPHQPMPLTEHSSVLAGDTAPTAYITSKILVEKAVSDFQNVGMDIIVARPFNHFGPGQIPGFLIPDWAAKIADSTGPDDLDVSRLNTWRDFSDVRDVAEAYVMLATIERTKLKNWLYNIASGKSYLTYELVSEMAKLMGKQLPPPPPEVDLMKIYGDHSRLTDDTGWNPTIPISRTVADFVAWFSSHPV